MKLVFEKPQRQQRIHIQKVSHGKSDRMSSTCSLVSCGAPSPALRTGKPVMGSRRIAAFLGRERRGARTIVPLFTLASSASPGRSPSLRRIGPGRTICPLLDMRVCMVRISYLTAATRSRAVQFKWSLRFPTLGCSAAGLILPALLQRRESHTRQLRQAAPVRTEDVRQRGPQYGLRSRHAAIRHDHRRGHSRTGNAAQRAPFLLTARTDRLNASIHGVVETSWRFSRWR